MDVNRQESSDNRPLCCVSIDVEEYFHVEAAYRRVGPAQWDQWPSRVDLTVERVLELLACVGRRGTFFILGHVAQRHPRLAPRIASAGHEVASHGTNHDRLHRLTPASFRDDLMTSKKLLEDQTGRRVIGYRAPTFSVTRDTAWAIDVLVECGLEYDASIFPVYHPLYGVPSAPEQPFVVRGVGGAELLEVPPLTLKLGARKLAVAGGGYFRLLPSWFMRRGLAQAATRQRPAVLYFHPWEFDPHMPRMPLSLTGRIRTYTGLSTSAQKLKCILGTQGRWSPIVEALGELREMAGRLPVFDLKPRVA